MKHKDRIRSLAVLAIAVGCVFTLACAGGETQYPETRKVDQSDDYNGTTVVDPYRWLEDVDSEETLAWVEAQNKVTFAYLESIPERDRIRERLTLLWNYPRYGVPSKEGALYIFSLNDGLQNQSVIYKQAGLEAEPDVLLDPNELSEDGTVALTTLAFTEDGQRMVYGTAASGSDWQEFYVRDVATGRNLEGPLRWIKFSDASWTQDGAGFFYSRYPEPEQGDTYESVNLNQRVYYHRLGTAQSEDELVYARPDEPEWGFDATVTDEGRYVVFSVGHGTDERNRVHYLDLQDAAKPRLEGEVVRLLDGFDASYELVGNDGPVFYFLTNQNAPMYRLIAVDTASPERNQWREVIPESDDVLESLDIINNRFVARYLHDAHSQIRIYSLAGQLEKALELPTLGSVPTLHGKREDAEMFYSFESFLYPSTVYRYEFATGASSVFRSPEIDFDPSSYETKQVFYTSKDGTRVPMFLTHRKGISLDGSNPTVLYGYGGFNISLPPRFSTSNLIWLEMGGVYAQANLRGGGEYGERWHRAGMLENKQNVFDDFIAAAEYLIDEGYTSVEKLAAAGGSNGGLLVGAVLNQRPDLFGAALPAVGVMDMLRFHKFTIGWAWVSDYGSAEDPEMFKVLYAYSPYHNLEPGTMYPPTLVTTADHDDRVVPGHSFKYAARLQEAQAGDAPTLIRIQTKAGHGAGKPTRMIIEEQADRWAFLVKNLNIDWSENH